MSLITPPPITIEDLHAFQAKHFPGSVIAQTPQLQTQQVTNTNQPEEYPSYNHEAQYTLEEEQYEYYYYEEEEEEEDLGYYPDGVKRTLTDEQIRIFRHSEIHALRREKELREEEEADAAAAAAERAVAADADANAKSNAAGTEQASKSRAEGKGDVDVKMDYGDGDGCASASASNPTSKAASRPVPQFTGRRIVSYDD
ncbi:hypothetical protein BO83DRAFT_389998 [Aspergillus eucalypticola CBS 122712]|uniref:Uncharacterized protein n=1 Tax=Aspergillus eucalypticola (strain CBS 122712 / IBT 29274) TaxID=1448314 RepID=A0A317VDC0_ASPEC|nr:uncharacterized protein BO83DRAFT_389998 [Aspergillus eucalypticola CBS 122712]PWY69880.1 hypothetical protein BO83DRAFT_389998 [Aspergillus eucalypticola CBS 122712]